MNEFEIEFEFQNKIFKATVARLEMEPIQYHVTQINPHSEQFPEIIMIIWNDSEKQYNWAKSGVADSLQNLIMKEMLNAILNKLIDLNVSIP